ncbi:MAG: trypsin-like peptidase domain-containing protein [Patescibacteria group bacterium]
MDNLTRAQLVLLVLLVSFVTSLFTGIVTATLVNQTPPPITQTVNRVVEKTIETVTPGSEEKMRVITQEDLVVKLVDDYSSAVVSVVATKDIPVIEQYFVDPFEGDDLFGGLLPPGFFPEFQIPQYRQNGTERTEVSGGTGFFVTADGYLLTNKHVVSDKKADYSVITNDGRKFSATVLARDPSQDIAILKIEGENFNYIPLGDSDSIKVGQSVVAIGNTLGEFQNTVSLGVISGLNRSFTANDSSGGTELLQEVIQTDAAINPGNSGGPLLDLSGRAVAMNTAVARDAENVGFALPINIAKKYIADIQEFGEIRFAYLGVRYLVVTDMVKEEKGLSVDYGALLINGDNGESAIMTGSPAEVAGLKEGDIILEMDGVKIDKDHRLAKLLSNKRVGDTINMKVLRGEEQIDLEVTLDERPENL